MSEFLPPFPFSLFGVAGTLMLLYLVTLLLHALFMSYVLAGTLVVAFVRLHGPSADGPVTRTLVDWLPFALSAAITAGIGPLLFVQLLHTEAFYTANLLLSHRWMSITPVLIGAFYLLYLLKAKPHARRLSALVATVVALATLFVAGSWVENHLLSLDSGAWVEHYVAGALFHREPAILPRLAFWVALAFPTASWLIHAQLRGGASGTQAEDVPAAARTLALASLVGLVLATALAVPVLSGSWSRLSPELVRFEHELLPALAIAAAGVVFQLVAWLPALRRRALSGVHFVAGSLGVVASWWGVLCAREIVRRAHWAESEVDPYFWMEKDGRTVFLVFAVLALGLTVWIFRSVARSLRRAA